MKTRAFIIISFLLAVTILISAIVFQPSPVATVGPHNGVMKQSGNYYIEMKAGYPGFYAFLFDNRIKPINNKGISCQVKFEFWDETTFSAVLKPFGEDGFFIGSYAPKFSSCKISFDAFGKHIAAEFENENVIAKKDK